jgi:Ser/Thr protein kinase RdoA (MazF antagonist)
MRAKELERVLSLYDISGWHKGRALLGATSANTVIHTSQNSFVLKKKRGPLSSRTTHEHALLEYLGDADIQVPRLIRNTAGLTYTECLGSHYSLTQLIDGMSYTQCSRHLGTNEPMIEDAGTSLARLQQAITSIPASGELGRQLEQDTPDMNWRIEVVDRLLENGPATTDGDSDFIMSIADIVRQKLVEAQECYRSDVPTAPIQLVHYDFSPKNLIFAENGSVAGILDFGNTCVDLRIADLERFLFALRPSKCTPPDYRAARVFLKAYSRHLRLADDEISRIPQFAVWRRMRQIARIMDASLRPRNDPRKRRFSRRRVTIKELWADTSWIIANTNMIADKLVATTKD